MRYKIAYKDKDQFDRAHSAAVTVRQQVFNSWKSATDPDEKAFYMTRVNEFDALIALYEAVLISDKSQDAEPDQDEEEED